MIGDAALLADDVLVVTGAPSQVSCAVGDLVLAVAMRPVTASPGD